MANPAMARPRRHHQHPAAPGIDLRDVLTLRLVNATTEHHAHYTPDTFRQMIRTEMTGEIQAHWQRTLNEAIASLRAG